MREMTVPGEDWTFSGSDSCQVCLDLESGRYLPSPRDCRNCNGTSQSHNADHPHLGIIEPCLGFRPVETDVAAMRADLAEIAASLRP